MSVDSEIARWNNRAVFYPANCPTGPDAFHEAPVSFTFDRAGYYVWRHDPTVLGGWMAIGPFRSPDSKACKRAMSGK